MPTSPDDALTMVTRAIRECHDRYGGVHSVLDLGCGDGIYGALARRYLDHIHNRFGPDEWRARLVGVEGHEGFRTHSWGYYDTLHVDTIQGYFAKNTERFDVVLALDVMEHLPFREALEMLREAYSRTNKYLIVGSPSTHREQWQPEKPWETELQEHRCLLLPETSIEKLFPRHRILYNGRAHWVAIVINEFLPIRDFARA